MLAPAKVPNAGAKGSLWVVGTGIRAVSQATPECRLQIERADIVLYSVSDSITEQWLHELNPRCESLAPLYAVGRPRLEIYEAMTARVVAAVRQGLRVCVALYGHPGVCARAGHASIRLLREIGHEARMLPGVSCEDCLFADLGVDPAAHGCQSHEATLFLSRRMRFDPRAALVLWQIGMLGHHDYQAYYAPQGLPELVALLREGYGGDHRAVVYELPNYASQVPLVEECTIDTLPRASMTWASTLYLPPRP